MPFSQTPAYTLKAVLQETGLAADTLRAWERRYGLPAPQRTAGGHRLYSQYDVETVKWLIARQNEGLSISRAVEMWKEQIASGSDPLADSASSTILPAANFAPGTSLDTIRARWLEACLSFNETQAEQTLNQAFALFPIEAVCMEVLQRGLSEIGMQWYENRATVQQEHFASALAMRRMDTLISAAPAPTRNKNIVIGCPANEWHTFTPLLLALVLRRRGWNVIYLGANVPVAQFQEMIETVKVDLVVLVAQQLTTAASLQVIAQVLNQHQVHVGFGGRIFNIQPNLVPLMAGHFLGASIESAVSEIEALVTTPARGLKFEAGQPENITAREYFQSRRAQIEATLYKSIDQLGFSSNSMKTATEFLGDNILASLQLGDIKLVNSEIEWVRSLLKANHIPEQALGSYMKMYAEAVSASINGAGKPITQWMEQFSGRQQ